MRAGHVVVTLCSLLVASHACWAQSTPKVPAEVQPPASGAGCDSVRLLPQAIDRCQFVRENCEADSLIPYLQLFYCYARPAGLVAEVPLQVFLVLLILLIFRLLGSTAEDFFSPILTQISQDLGLPPRFAGVTLLALGNGAPDLVSSIAFVKAGKYRVALSGLLGGGMFVGAAVAGAVIWTAGGVKARGALMRDVSSYMASVAVVAVILSIGRMTWALAALLLVMYLLFVCIVLTADVIHLRQHGFRRAEPEHREDEQPLLAEISQPPVADLGREPCNASTHSIEMTEGQRSGQLHSDTMGERTFSHSLISDAGSHLPPGSTWSAENLTYNERLHMSGQAYRQMALAELASSTTFFGNVDIDRARRLALLEEASEEAEAGYSPPKADDAAAAEAEAGHYGSEDVAPQATAGVSSEHEERLARVHEWCSGEWGGPLAPSRRGSAPLAESIKGGRQLPDGLKPVIRAGELAWQGACGCAKGLGYLLAAAEYPIYLLRRVTIPLVDNDSYDRRWLVAAFVGMPVAILWYLGKLSLLLTLPVALAVGASLAALVYFTTVPDRAPDWNLGTPFPLGAAAVAAAGFVVSAMWIDTIAGELVALLGYFGTLSGIPHEVLGLTVLAWGNSIGDLSTDVAMAKRGLSNMAMTACFAGPIINLLVALGIGFIRFLAGNSLSSTPVQLDAMDYPAIIMVMVNGLSLMAVGTLYRSWVPGWYGAVPLVFYALYIAVSLAVAFG